MQKTVSNFKCSTCSTPLSLDPSLLSIPSNLPTSTSHASKHINLADSFVLLPTAMENTRGNGGNFSERIKVTQKLFSLLNSASCSVSHPMCHSCASETVGMLEKRMASIKEERDMYSSLIEKLNKEEQDQEGEQDDEEQDNQVSLRVLQDLTRECSILQQEIKLKKEELNREKEIQDLKWIEFNRIEQENRVLQVVNEIHDAKSLWIHSRTQELNSTSVYNDVFRISYQGQFGTINGLRLGLERFLNIQGGYLLRNL